MELEAEIENYRLKIETFSKLQEEFIQSKKNSKR